LRLARFEVKNARRVEVTQGSEKLVLVGDDQERWQVEVKGETAGGKALMPADKNKVNDLLNQLSGLSAADEEGDARHVAAGVAALLGSPPSPAPLLTGAAAYASRWRAGGVSPLSWPNPLATVKLTLSEEDRSEGEAKKKTREITLVIGE